MVGPRVPTCVTLPLRVLLLLLATPRGLLQEVVPAGSDHTELIPSPALCTP